MAGSWSVVELPNLTEGVNCTVTSPASNRYNCIASAAGENFRNWWPDAFGIGYWPPGVARSETTQAFLLAYGTQGFTLCFDGTLEIGIEKIAIFGKGAPGTEVPTHAALQLETGHWTSKAAKLRVKPPSKNEAPLRPRVATSDECSCATPANLRRSAAGAAV